MIHKRAINEQFNFYKYLIINKLQKTNCAFKVLIKNGLFLCLHLKLIYKSMAIIGRMHQYLVAISQCTHILIGYTEECSLRTMAKTNQQYIQF